MNNTVLIIGAGRVGTTVYRFIKEKMNIPVFLTDIKPVFKSNGYTMPGEDIIDFSAKQNIEDYSIIFITVPDDEIVSVVNKLQKNDLNNKIILHTSGACGLSVFDVLKRQHAAIGSFHPLQTFTGLFLRETIWKGIICTYQGDEKGYGFVKHFCGMAGAELIRVTAEQKIAIHTAGVLVSNLYFALLKAAEKVLETYDLKNEARSMLIPLIRQTIENYQRYPVADALTGPLKRGDINTIKSHLDFLNGQEEIRQLYKVLSKTLLNDVDLDEEKKKTLQELFDDAE
ncbi:MAG: DUF2520 domain-containing protein [Calditrichaceae bacterium]|nr:DUF2520 domain-containing protein [Calditrichaceae bacterium]MBN2707751.1 DUF2520 domain-containing protein [Calditrichaceae bacterium]RQV96386.1 MAG: DUF2520 domain-containing protein [Calditrichota bacterium]